MGALRRSPRQHILHEAIPDQKYLPTNNIPSCGVLQRIRPHT